MYKLMKTLKRYFKDVVLILLVLSSLVMACQIWFGQYIASTPYSDFLSGARSFLKSPISFFGGSRNTTFSYNIKRLLKPEKIVVNRSANRRVVTENEAGFSDVWLPASELLTAIFSGEAKITGRAAAADTEEYFAALKGKSIYIDYGSDYDLRLIAMSIAGESKTGLSEEIPSAGEILILFNENVLNNVYVYFRNSSAAVTKLSVEYNKAKLDNVVNDFFKSLQTDTVPSYSYELNFHKSAEGRETKVLFAPDILIRLVPEATVSITGKSLLSSGGDYGLAASAEDTVLRAFKINPMTMRKYTDISGSSVFVENYGTLSISPDGLLEYKTLEGSHGIPLSDEKNDTNPDVYRSAIMAVDFIGSVCNAFPSDVLENLKISSIKSEVQGKLSRYVIKLDCCVNGLPVFVSEDGKISSAVEMVIEDGFLMSYRQYVMEYYNTNESYPGTTVISAADKIIESVPSGELPIYINRFTACYVYDGSEVINKKWEILIDKKSDAVIVG